MHFTRNFPENQVERNNKYRFVLDDEEKIERLTERTTCSAANSALTENERKVMTDGYQNRRLS